jgi:hypothetical protein
LVPVKHLKSILALFALLVFLFPQVEKEVHQYLHAVNVHCEEHDVVHFHNVEHHCFLCDFTSPVSPTPFPQKLPLQSIIGWNNRFSTPSFLTSFNLRTFIPSADLLPSPD